jgi:glycine/D-amino acid oxidase-like deaminating enzyme
LLGEDPEVLGLFHATALGGHGITCAAPVGRIVAEAVWAWKRDQRRTDAISFSL